MFAVNGRTIRVRDSMRMVSPVNYRVSTTIAVDAGRFTNFGNPWFKKSYNLEVRTTKDSALRRTAKRRTASVIVVES